MESIKLVRIYGNNANQNKFLIDLTKILKVYLEHDFDRGTFNLIFLMPHSIRQSITYNNLNEATKELESIQKDLQIYYDKTILKE